jgi:hypothetical protein
MPSIAARRTIIPTSPTAARSPIHFQPQATVLHHAAAGAKRTHPISPPPRPPTACVVAPPPVPSAPAQPGATRRNKT